MKKIIKTTIIALSISGAGTVIAGQQNLEPVSITNWSATKTATGTVIGAKNASGNEYIECVSRPYKVGNSMANYADCRAQTSSGAYLSGYTSEPEFIQAIQSVNSSSRIHFEVENSTGKLTRVTIQNGSKYLD